MKVNTIYSRVRVASYIVIVTALVTAAAVIGERVASASPAATVTWDGGGATNNWSEAANWSGDTLPGSGDNVVFDATSTKNATIDATITVGSIQIGSTYTGTITQSNGAPVTISGCSGRPCFKQDGGTFTGSSSTITLDNIGFGALTITGGTFTGGSGDILMNGNGATFSMLGGTFTSTSGDLSCTGIVRFQGTSVFNHNNGTVTLTSNAGQFITGDSGHTSVHLNNLAFSAGDGVNYDLGLRVIVDGTLTLNDGQFGAGNNGSVIEARGPVTISPNFDGGIGTLEFANGAAPRVITFSSDLHIPRLHVNDPNVTINTTGPGPVTFPHRLTLSAGTINQGSVELVINDVGGGGFCYTQNGGTFNGSDKTITLNSDGFGAIRMNGGAFNGGSGDILLAGTSADAPDLSMLGGTFKSTSGTLTTAGLIRTQGTSSFLHNNGTVTLTASGNSGAITGDSNHPSITFNDLNFNFADGANFLIGPRTIVLGHAAFNNGTIGQNGSVIEVRGTYDLAPTFDGGNFSLEFGPAGSPRILTLTAGLTYPKIVLSDPGLTLNTAGSGTLVLPHQLIIRNGTFNQGNVDLLITPLDIGGGACLEMTGGTFNGSDHLLTLTSNGFNTIYMHDGGTFNGGSGNIVTTGPGTGIVAITATFKSTSGTLFAGRSFVLENTAFNANGGTVVFDEGADGVNNFVILGASDIQGNPTSIVFNDLIIDKNPSATILIGATDINVTGQLALNDGRLDTAGHTNVNAFSDVAVGADFDGFSSRVDLRFSGTACQIVSITGTQSFVNDWVVNKTACGITAIGNFGVHAISVPNGNLVFAGGTQATLTGDMTVDANGSVTTSGGGTVINIGANVTNSGSVDLSSIDGSTDVNIGGDVTNGGTLDLSSIDGSTDVNIGGDVTNSGSVDISSIAGSTDVNINGITTTSGTVDLSGLDNSIILDSLTVEPGGRFTVDGNATITLSGNVVNNGVVDLQGGGAVCPESDTVIVRSSEPGTARLWSGGGGFALTDVDLQDQGGAAAVNAFSSTNSGNVGANFTFDPGCPTGLSISPTVAGAVIGTNLVFSASGGIGEHQFSLLTNNSGGSITTNGSYTAGSTPDVADVVRVTDSVGNTADATVNVTGPSVKLAFIVQPTTTGVGAIISPPIKVAIQDEAGSTVTSATGQISLAISNDPSGGMLGGSLSKNAVAGIAVFDDISIDTIGSGYTLSADSAGLQAVVSDPFNIVGAAQQRTVRADYDGDGKTDLSIFRPSEGSWYALGSKEGFLSTTWGLGTDEPLAGDLNGDHNTDLIVRRINGAQAELYVLYTNDFTYEGIVWGFGSDKTLIADYDGDGADEIAVFRPSEGAWYIRDDASNYRGVTWGGNGDVPVAGDFDGDGRADLAVYRPADNNWYVASLTGSAITGTITFHWGLATDKLVPADYDGDGKDDFAVWRPEDGYWYINRSSDQAYDFIHWGGAGDIPVPGDYDGDGKYDVAVFRDGGWYVLGTQSGFISGTWGAGSDVPMPSKYLP